MKPYILAMDSEETLISNEISQIPRPGLYKFLESMRRQFDRLVMFTTVPESLVRMIGYLLAREGAAPPWFHVLDYIEWSGKTKDLRLVFPVLGRALLLDDHEAHVHPGQSHLWIEAPLFASPYDSSDPGRVIAGERIARRLSQSDHT